VAKRGDLSSKREVSERIGKDKNDMEQKEVDLEKVASDVETCIVSKESGQIKGIG
jgi:hypothetical protein